VRFVFLARSTMGMARGVQASLRRFYYGARRELYWRVDASHTLTLSGVHCFASWISPEPSRMVIPSVAPRPG
jgi:hypothetical protein